MLNQALRLLRTYHQLRQVDLADRLSISNSYLSELEKGAPKRPSLDLLDVYAVIFDMPVSSILLLGEMLDGPRVKESQTKRTDAKLLLLVEWFNQRKAIAPPAAASPSASGLRHH